MCCNCPAPSRNSYHTRPAKSCLGDLNSLLPFIAGRAPFPTEHLHVTSKDLQNYFQKHKIVPTVWAADHPEFKDIFLTEEPDIALTYEWKTSFTLIFEYLKSDNISAHNRAAKDLNPSLWERVYWMSFLWVLLGPPRKLPEDIDNKTIWIDILFNDQTVLDQEDGNERLQAVLAEAEERWFVVFHQNDDQITIVQVTATS
jgi:hypothetical protein